MRGAYGLKIYSYANFVFTKKKHLQWLLNKKNLLFCSPFLKRYIYDFN